MWLRIYRFELGKILGKKYILAAILGVVAIMLGSLLYYKLWDGQWLPDYNQFKRWQGPYTTQIQKTLDSWQSHWVEDKTQGAVLQASTNVGSYQMYVDRATHALTADESGTYQQKVDALHQDKLKEAGSPGIYYVGAWKQVFQVMDYQGYIYLGALIVLGVSPIFSAEFTTNVFSTLRSTRHGRRKLVAAKLGAAVTFAAIISIGVTTLNVVATGLLFGFHGWNVPLNNLYPDTPYAITIGHLMWMQFGLCLLACVAFSILISLLSLLSRSSMVTLFIAYTLLFVPSFLYSSVGQNVHWVKILCDFSYTEMIQLSPYVQWFDALNWFGTPVLPMHIVVITQFLLSMVFVVWLYRRFGRVEAV